MLSENLIRTFEPFVVTRWRGMSATPWGARFRRLGSRIPIYLRLIAFGLPSGLLRGLGSDI